MTKKTAMVLGAALVVAGGAALAVGGSPPRDLEQLTEASERAGEESKTITANLERIAANLEEGASLPSDTKEIRALTDEQHGSLARLAELLEGQLAALGAGTQTLEDTEDTTGSLARLSSVQARILQRAVEALGDLRDYASDAARASAAVERAARYGAELAEDSQRAFGR